MTMQNQDPWGSFLNSLQDENQQPAPVTPVPAPAAVAPAPAPVAPAPVAPTPTTPPVAQPKLWPWEQGFQGPVGSAIGSLPDIAQSVPLGPGMPNLRTLGNTVDSALGILGKADDLTFRPLRQAMIEPFHQQSQITPSGQLSRQGAANALMLDPTGMLADRLAANQGLDATGDTARAAELDQMYRQFENVEGHSPGFMRRQDIQQASTPWYLELMGELPLAMIPIPGLDFGGPAAMRGLGRAGDMLGGMFRSDPTTIPSQAITPQTGPLSLIDAAEQMRARTPAVMEQVASAQGIPTVNQPRSLIDVAGGETASPAMPPMSDAAWDALVARHTAQRAEGEGRILPIPEAPPVAPPSAPPVPDDALDFLVNAPG